MSATALRAPVSLTLGRTTVRFTWRHDRWMHEILFPDGTAWRSLEGPAAPEADPRWPASPVLVDLSRLEGPHGPALLGVGRAGRSHFSASIGPAPARADRILFELACRVTEPPGWLGSTYAGPGGIVRIEPAAGAVRPPATLEWGYESGPEGVRPLGGARIDSLPPAGD
jgi:hypothetical protein